jgi:hypothetical protein
LSLLAPVNGAHAEEAHPFSVWEYSFYKSLLRNLRWPALTGRNICRKRNELHAGGKKAASGGLRCPRFRLLSGPFGTPGRLPV